LFQGGAASSRYLYRAIDSNGGTVELWFSERRKLKPIQIRQSRYLNNRIEQDHRAIKRRIRPMLGFKSINSARAILSGIEMVHLMRKQQANYAHNPQPSLAEQFDLLAA
jgi:transposase-like protein